MALSPSGPVIQYYCHGAKIFLDHLMYSFLLILNKTDARLELFRDGEMIAAKSWQESRDLGRQLFQAIEMLLSENNLNPEDVTDFRLETAVSDNFTSVKIAETVAKVYTWAVSEGKLHATDTE